LGFTNGIKTVLSLFLPEFGIIRHLTPEHPSLTLLLFLEQEGVCLIRCCLDIKIKKENEKKWERNNKGAFTSENRVKK